MIERELEKLASALDAVLGTAVEETCGILSESAIDLVMQREFQQAESVYRRLQRLVDGFVAQRGLEIEETDGYLAGQVASLATLFGTISARLPASFEELAEKTMSLEKYRKVFNALLEAEQTTSALAKAVREDKSTISRKLTDLRHLGLVHSTGSGRLVHSRLTTVARAIFLRLLIEERRTSGSHTAQPVPMIHEFPVQITRRFEGALDAKWFATAKVSDAA